MQHHRGTFFGEVQKSLAAALHDAGQTDREIADATSTSVNNIIVWRRDAGRSENLSPEAQALAEEEAYRPPVTHEPRARRPVPALIAQPAFAAPASDPRLITPQEAQIADAAPVQPDGDGALEIGTYMDAKVFVDLEELLTTRLLVQGNSGSGKSHLLRKLLEESAGIVQQIVVDPEGDFVSFGEAFGHAVVTAVDHSATRLRQIAGKARQHRGSVILNLDGLDLEHQMDAVAAFLSGLFDAPRECWHPALVVVDEAHLFAPSQDNGEDREIRKASQQAMADLMCRGRKRGLAGVIATQRLAKLHKNVAAEASNFLMGRTFLDIDIARAADLLGIPTRSADDIRTLNRGEFLGLGPAIARRPLKVKVGAVTTAGKASAAQGLTPLPSIAAGAMASLMLAEDDPEPVAPKLRAVK
ncbi:MAG: helicase HerA domain-containing protein [Janthinobacterium lividum]